MHWSWGSKQLTRTTAAGPAKLALAFAVGLALFVVVIFWITSGNKVSVKCVRVESPAVRWLSSAQWSWLSKREIIFLETVEGQPRLGICNLEDGSRHYPHWLEDTVHSMLPISFSSLSMHEGRLLIYLGGASGWFTLLAKPDGTLTWTNRLPRPVFQHFWVPGSTEWLEISGTNAWLEKAIGKETQQMDADFNPCFAIGFLTNRIFLCATNQTPPYPAQVLLEYWEVKNSPKLRARKSVRISSHDQIVAAYSSPSGESIIWECYHSSRLPALSLSRRFPFVKLSRESSIRIYESSTEADRFLVLAQLPRSSEVPYIHWTPDGQYATFLQSGSLFMMPVTSRSFTSFVR